MNPLLQLADHALVLFAGSTTLLALGCGWMAWLRSPAHRQRLGELTVAGVLVWLILALIPLPRMWSSESAWSEGKRDENAAREGRAQRVIHPNGLEQIKVPAGEMQEHLANDAEDDSAPFHAESTVDPPGLPFGPAPPTMVRQTLRSGPDAEHAADQIEAGSAPITAANAHPGVSIPGAAGRMIGLGYLAGALACAAWLGVGHLLLLRIRRGARPADGWLIELARFSDRASPLARIVTSASCSRPMSFGVFRPVIVLPEALCRRESATQLRMLLLHELAHVVRRDAWGNAVLNLALPVLYAHPLYWWLKGQVRMAAELIADDWAARFTGKEAYASELIALAKSCGRVPLPIAGAAGLFTSSSQFFRRMQMLLQREQPLATRPAAKWRWSVVSIMGLAVGLAVAVAGLQPASGRPADETSAAAKAPNGNGRDSDSAVADSSEKIDKRIPVLADLPLLGRLFAIEGDTEGAEGSDITAEDSAITSKTANGTTGSNDSESAGQRALRTRETNRRQIKFDDLKGELDRVLSSIDRYENVLAIAKGDARNRAEKRMTELKARKEDLVSQIDSLGAQLDESAPEAGAERPAPAGSAERPVRTESLSRRIIRQQEIKLTTQQLESTIEHLSSMESRLRIPGNEKFREDILQQVGKLEAERDSLAKKLDRLDADQQEVELLGYERAEARRSDAQQRAATLRKKSEAEARMIENPQAASDQKALAGALAGRVAGQLDLVALAVTYGEALATIEELREKLRGYGGAAPGAVPREQVNQARATLRGAERKAKLLEGIAKAALSSTEAELNRLTKLYESGRVDQSNVLDVQARLDILQEILKPDDERP